MMRRKNSFGFNILHSTFKIEMQSINIHLGSKTAFVRFMRAVKCIFVDGFDEQVEHVGTAISAG